MSLYRPRRRLELARRSLSKSNTTSRMHSALKNQISARGIRCRMASAKTGNTLDKGAQKGGVLFKPGSKRCPAKTANASKVLYKTCTATCGSASGGLLWLPGWTYVNVVDTHSARLLWHLCQQRWRGVIACLVGPLTPLSGMPVRDR